MPNRAKEDRKPYYITTTLPYVNSDPHIGFAMELIRADVSARYRKLRGQEVYFNTGTDEHGLKIYRKARDAGQDTQSYVDGYAAKFRELIPLLSISPDVNFIRTTDPHHVRAAQEFWKIADKNGLIYKKNYSVKYCVGCELEKTESDLVDGRCPLHPLLNLEIIEEENYFFRFSIYRKALLDLYERQEQFVIPAVRQNEIRAFVERGLEDFSVSRLAAKMPWGIPVPGDEGHVMYVWFDALVNYVSAAGWPDEPQKFQKWWVDSGGVVQYCGKDNLRQQAAMWQAMLMAVKLPPSRRIVINGFITGEGGVKMSKSLGNTVDPVEIVREYGSDALRYYVCRELSPHEDSPFSADRFKESYNAHLANGLGNLVSRVIKMAVSAGLKCDPSDMEMLEKDEEIRRLRSEYEAGFEKYDLMQSANAVWTMVRSADMIVQEREPFKRIKTEPDQAKKDIKELLARLKLVAEMLLPIMPETGTKISGLIERCQMPEKPLFARK